MIPFPAHAVAPGLRVVILTCGELGFRVANTLRREKSIDVVAVLRSPWLRRRLTLAQKFRHVIRTQGIGGLFHVGRARLFPEPAPATEAAKLDENVSLVEVEDFHSPDSRETLRELKPDLGVVVGTYILRDGVYDIPRFGSINLHSGKTPQYRGSAPAFWEMYNGETEIGITIHRVAEDLDAGDVLRQETFPLDSAPLGDPLSYIEDYRREVLRPNGIRMLVDAVRDIAAGGASPCEQDHRLARTYPSPSYRDVVELRSRVRRRRGTVS
jgi:folate-dependent phosphoribosylglycinamide formyltransferase PurN